MTAELIKHEGRKHEFLGIRNFPGCSVCVNRRLEILEGVVKAGFDPKTPIILEDELDKMKGL